MQFVNFLVDPVRLSIDLYEANDVSQFQVPIMLEFSSIDEVLVNLTELSWNIEVGSSNNFGRALDLAHSVFYSGFYRYYIVFALFIYVLDRMPTTDKTLLF